MYGSKQGNLDRCSLDHRDRGARAVVALGIASAQYDARSTSNRFVYVDIRSENGGGNTASSSPSATKVTASSKTKDVVTIVKGLKNASIFNSYFSSTGGSGDAESEVDEPVHGLCTDKQRVLCASGQRTLIDDCC